MEFNQKIIANIFLMSLRQFNKNKILIQSNTNTEINKDSLITICFTH